MVWKYNNPSYHIAKPMNVLKWGVHSANVQRIPKSESVDKQERTTVDFFYRTQPVKSYEKKGRYSEKWVDKTINKYVDSNELDEFMYGEED